ncbi:MAG: hypothetical protein JO249_01935 [Acidobacteria bacterium]|nr:hypothetical protein [Acidobacteriota bacterium]
MIAADVKHLTRFCYLLRHGWEPLGMLEFVKGEMGQPTGGLAAELAPLVAAKQRAHQFPRFGKAATTATPVDTGTAQPKLEASTRKKGSTTEGR